MVILVVALHRSPAPRQKTRERLDSGHEGVAKAVEEEEPEPDDEETSLMKQMMGFSKFDTTKVRSHYKVTVLVIPSPNRVNECLGTVLMHQL